MCEESYRFRFYDERSPEEDEAERQKYLSLVCEGCDCCAIPDEEFFKNKEGIGYCMEHEMFVFLSDKREEMCA